ncbi:MAG: hypothetical protein A3J79_06320 [Elusimicrobia bacterium RIFOXYB2_FULL_62_6]|nr:MAG: hypothetical protein A3J79_06320 [Elusimicrobia bacterium RIFOXYB2_FULL_62_6]
MATKIIIRIIAVALETWGVLKLDRAAIKKVANDESSTLPALSIVFLWAALPGLVRLDGPRIFGSVILVGSGFLLMLGAMAGLYRLAGSNIRFMQLFRVLGLAFVVCWPANFLGPVFTLLYIWVLIVLYRAAEILNDRPKAEIGGVFFVTCLYSSLYFFFSYVILAEIDSGAGGPPAATSGQAVPAGTGALPGDIPVYGDAAVTRRDLDINGLGRLYLSGTDTKDAIYEAYLKGFAGANWRIVERENSRYGNFAVIKAKKSGRSLVVDIRQNFDKTSDIRIESR